MTVVAAPRLTDVSPALESGDRLTAGEFRRRFHQRPDIRKAELIEGVVYVASPARAPQHGDPEGDPGTWLGAYRARRPELRISHNATVRLDADNEVQPDVCLRRITGGTSRELDGYIHGPPELVAEIAASSDSVDLHDKKHAYRRAGVQEYIVWRTIDQAIDWCELHEGEYRLLGTDDGGVVHSRVFPGLRLDPSHLLAGDLAAALTGLD